MLMITVTTVVIADAGVVVVALLGDGEAGRDRVAATEGSHDRRQILVHGHCRRRRVHAGDTLRTVTHSQDRRRRRSGRTGRPVHGEYRRSLSHRR